MNAEVEDPFELLLSGDRPQVRECRRAFREAEGLRGSDTTCGKEEFKVNFFFQEGRLDLIEVVSAQAKRARIVHAVGVEGYSQRFCRRGNAQNGLHGVCGLGVCGVTQQAHARDCRAGCGRAFRKVRRDAAEENDSPSLVWGTYHPCVLIPFGSLWRATLACCPHVHAIRSSPP